MYIDPGWLTRDQARRVETLTGSFLIERTIGSQ